MSDYVVAQKVFGFKYDSNLDVVTVDGQRHLDLRSVMATLFTPSRLKALEPSLASTAVP